MKVIVVFVDGVGIGVEDGKTNPFFAADLPVLRSLLGDDLPSLREPIKIGRSCVALPLDACLGVSGLPQSGTGQVALLTGANAPELFGRHFGPWVPVALRSMLRQDNLFRRAQLAGFNVCFANAYPKSWRTPPDDAPRKSVTDRRAARLRTAAHPLAAATSGVLIRHRADLCEGRAIASEIVNEGWRRRFPGPVAIPEVTPDWAGRRLAAFSEEADLTYFAHYTTDEVGHSGSTARAVAALERVDSFLGGITANLDDDSLLLVVSDHGNIEDVSVGHTRNPTLCLIAGPDAERRSEGLRSIANVAAAVLDWLDE